MEKRLSELAEKEGFQAVKGVAGISNVAYALDQLQKEKGNEDREWLVLPRSQIKGSAPEYMIYNKIH